jgi:hypothetical protein
LSHDELVHIAFTRELVPDAAAALKTELANRGILDLSTQREEMVRQGTAQEQTRQRDMSHTTTISRKVTNLLGIHQ